MLGPARHRAAMEVPPMLPRQAVVVLPPYVPRTRAQMLAIDAAAAVAAARARVGARALPAPGTTAR